MILLPVVLVHDPLVNLRFLLRLSRGEFFGVLFLDGFQRQLLLAFLKPPNAVIGDAVFHVNSTKDFPAFARAICFSSRPWLSKFYAKAVPAAFQKPVPAWRER